MHDIADGLSNVQQRIADAATDAGRSPDEVTLVTVTKTRSAREVQQAIEAGATDLGENYVQELLSKKSAVSPKEDTELRWHVIGHLQRNKVKYIVNFCSLLHTVDSKRLADELQKRLDRVDRQLPVLIEVNIAGEDSKFGVGQQQAAPLADHIAGLSNVELRGLMTMTPYGVSEAESRRYFEQLRESAVELRNNLPQGAMEELSMGMTQDYEAAVAEGATLVRVGTAIFGPRSEANN